ncbi:MAG: hypothetical protein KDA25_01625 [Phycisphaerales bacterium]|nr:hypothetical protein [Phycisphaerales bacterium]
MARRDLHALVVSCLLLTTGAVMGAPAARPVPLDAAALRATVAVGARTTLRDVVLDDGRAVDLAVERFRVLAPEARLVVGRVGGGDRPFSFDADAVVLLRGHVVGDPDSHVFIATSPWLTIGRVEASGRHYELRGGADGATTIAPALAGGPVPGTPLCGTESPGGVVPLALPGVGGRPGEGLDVTQRIRLAVETDYEFFSLFDDLDAAMAYVLAMYAADADIFARDLDVRLELTFVRLWDTPEDMFNQPNPLNALRAFWNQNMQEVERDVVQFASGRRNLPYGGVAYVSAMCSQSAYSVVGYIVGAFSLDPDRGVFSYDVSVTAHELGHNFGTFHTHDYGLDNCNLLDNDPQRGTIMSYCGQTVSGAAAVNDLRFHTVTRLAMRAHVFFDAPCLMDDCNGNDIDDAVDILTGGSTDVDGNGVPDECEDCNGNGVVDGFDIGGGTSLDLDGNGVPDECEPDCNGNGIPDAKDIADGTSSDLWGDGVPDECETDCDGNGLSDYTEIQNDLSLDVNRNVILDACEDCDGDGVNDVDALDGAYFAWVASALDGPIARFHALTGVRTAVSSGTTLLDATDVRITPDRRVFVTSSDDGRVVEFDADGAFVGNFATNDGGDLAHPTFLALGPGDTLLVSVRDLDRVNEYDLATGTLVRTFSGGGLLAPQGLDVGPDGTTLYVATGDERVVTFDLVSGAALGEFVGAADNGGMVTARGLLFSPAGHLLVASKDTNQVLAFDGTTGAFIGQFNNGGTEEALTLDQPFGLRRGSDGHVYVSRHNSGRPGAHDDETWLDDHQVDALHINSTRIYVFEGQTGIFLRSYVTGNDTELDLPTGFDFLPDAGTDCNRNFRPDACDILSGASDDVNGNGVPDECETIIDADLNGDGVVGPADLAILLGQWGPCRGCAADLDGDGIVGPGDLSALLAQWS